MHLNTLYITTVPLAIETTNTGLRQSDKAQMRNFLKRHSVKTCYVT